MDTSAEWAPSGTEISLREAQGSAKALAIRLVDQPALWTENEGGFQVWGGAPPPGQEPYFWGRPVADQALSVMKWFARGGSHMDYYMWAGG